MCIFLLLGSFSLHKLGDTALIFNFLRGTLVDISTRGDTAYSDEVVLVNVHKFFFWGGGILGVSAFRAKGYLFKAKPVCRFLFGGTAS